MLMTEIRLSRDTVTPTALTQLRALEAVVETVTNAYESIASALQRIDDARRAATTVTLTVAPYFSARWLTPRLGRLWHEHPEIDLRLHHAYEPVDFQVDNVDLGVVWGKGRWPSANAVKVLDGGLIAVCNPAIRQQLGDPVDLTELAKFSLLYEFDAEHWRRWLEVAGLGRERDLSFRRIDDSYALRTAVIEGHGVGLFARSLLDEELAQGSLVAVGDHLVGDSHYYLTVPATRAMRPAVATVADWILARSVFGGFVAS
jgi:DNA-binding transcriptional LysR family regulator